MIFDFGKLDEPETFPKIYKFPKDVGCGGIDRSLLINFDKISTKKVKRK